MLWREDPLADLEALGKLADLLQQHISPLVAIEPAPDFAGVSCNQPQTLLLDITGIGDWFGDEQAILVEADRVLAEQGLQAKLAIADTSAAAWAVVKFSVFSFQFSGVCAKSHVLPPGELDGALQLPTRALRLDAETAHQLDRLGLRRIADVLELPRAGLAARLGSKLLRRIDELTGQTPQALVMHHPAIEDSAVCTLEYPTADRDILEHRLRGLVNRVAATLVARRRGALRLSCRLEMTQHPPQTLEIGLFIPTANADHLSRLVSGAIERYRLPSMVQRLTLSVTLGGLLQQYQPTLFADDSISQLSTRQSLARMIETLAGRLGRDAVVGIQASRNPLPEAAFKFKPLAGEARSTLSLGQLSGSRSPKKTTSPADEPALKSPRQSTLPAALGAHAGDPLRRPLRMFSVPQPLEIIEMGDEGVPRRIRIENRIHQVTRHWGPERIETGWWDGPQVRRDYYRIEIENGSWWWIFRQLGNPTAAIWKLHGQFT